jgi:hypothetical protein
MGRGLCKRSGPRARGPCLAQDANSPLAGVLSAQNNPQKFDFRSAEYHFLNASELSL